MFAGWITFSAMEVDDHTVAQAQVLMRASDPIFELGLALGGHKQEDVFWQQTMTAVAQHFGHEGTIDTRVLCVDPQRQWSRWRNIWQSSAIRSSMYMLGGHGASGEARDDPHRLTSPQLSHPGSERHRPILPPFG